MHVPSYEHCRELCALSGWRWGGSHLYYDEQATLGEILIGRPKPNLVPAYDMDYLLLRLPDDYGIVKRKKGKVWLTGLYSDGILSFHTKADTLQDALCLLLIELFQRGILKK